MNVDEQLDHAAEALEAWDGATPRALGPALDRLERLILEAQASGTKAAGRLQSWLSLTAVGAVTLAGLIDLAGQLEGESAAEAHFAGARLRDVVGALADQTAACLAS